MNIAIVDYDAGNLRNVQKAVEHLGFSANITSSTSDLNKANSIILPGVGSFVHGMEVLEKYDLVNTIRTNVLERKKPILGICLGMQLFAEYGNEGQKCNGIGLLPMVIKKLERGKMDLRIPHMGWNNIEYRNDSLLFKDVDPNPDFYFVHSYHAVYKQDDVVAATCNYCIEFVAAVEKENIFATQFHPEKSQRYGLKVLSNFLNYCNIKA